MTPPDRVLSHIQGRLEGYYALERAPAIRDFVVWTTRGRETTLVRQTDDGLDLCVALPRRERLGEGMRDHLLQLVEGVSHFLFLAERARVSLPTTQLELELQAEVDKFVVLSAARLHRGRGKRRAHRLHDTLYERVRYVHPAGTEQGDRYRLANDLASRMIRRVIERDDPTHARSMLRRFYRAGQAEKIRVASAGLS